MVKKIKDFILDWVWELPQNLVGLIYKKLIKKKIVESYLTTSNKNVSFLNTNRGGLSVGKYVFISERYSLVYMQHELGHCKQSRMLGPLYFLVIGIPSFIHSVIHNYVYEFDNYYDFYTESWANKLMGIKMQSIKRN